MSIYHSDAKLFDTEWHNYTSTTKHVFITTMTPILKNTSLMKKLQTAGGPLKVIKPYYIIELQYEMYAKRAICIGYLLYNR